MKKVIFTLIVFLVSIGFVNVSAEENNDLYCEYEYANNTGSSAYMLIVHFGSSNADTFDYELATIPDGTSAPSLFQPDTKDKLIEYGMLNAESGTVKCPSLAVKTSGENNGSLILWKDASSNDQVLSIRNQECPSTGCNFFNITEIVEKPIFECNYYSKTSNNYIHVIRRNNGDSITIAFPDGTGGSTIINESCPDFYYNSKNHSIKIARYDYLGSIKQMQTFDPTMYSFICGDSYENIEYYCNEGNCQYNQNASIKCGEVTSTIDKTEVNLGEFCDAKGIKQALRFIGYLIFTVKIIIPILLIVLGIVDFSKAVISSDTNALQNSIKSLVFRVIAAIVIFIIPTIVNFIFKDVIKTNNSRFSGCRICILEPRNCNLKE